MFFRACRAPRTCVKAFFACPIWRAKMISTFLMEYLRACKAIAPLGRMAHVRRKFERLAADGKNAATPSRRRARSMSWRKTSDTRNRHPRKWRRSERPKLAPFQCIRRLISWTYTNSTPMTKPWGKRRVMPSTYGYALAGRLRDGRFNTDNKLMEQAVRATTHGRKNPFKATARNDGGRLTKKRPQS